MGRLRPNFGDYDVRTLAALATEAEATGWDGFFIWDHLLWAPVSGSDIADTTVALTAIALATERVRFGALVTPLGRRRPWKLAKETATLDRLSRGRLVVGVGLGAQGDIAPFGEGEAPRALAKVLDEGLDLFRILERRAHHPPWRAFRRPRRGAAPDAAAVSHSDLGRRILAESAAVPARRPLRRSAAPYARPPDGGTLPRGASPVPGLHQCTPRLERPIRPRGLRHPAAHARHGGGVRGAGATWWIDAVDPLAESLADVRARIARGPPS